MTERRYSDSEIRDIFEHAATPAPTGLHARQESSGLTLAEIQGIGREVGLDPAAMAAAAGALSARSATPLRHSVGMPVAVGRVVPLPRALTDLEWERLVSELRAAFGATGRVAVQGNLRQWSNGNLHACVEPSGAGYQLRLGTLKGGARDTNLLGIMGVAAGSGLAALIVVAAAPIAPVAPLVLGGAGAAALISNAVRLPRWARTRQQQMELIAATVTALVGEDV
jgi:hypothetical protein